VSGCDAVDTSQYTYFQTTLCSTETTTLYGININTLHQKDCTTLANRRAFYTRIYFVTNNNQAGDGIPTLKVAELGSGGFTTSALAAGIQQLQLEYGLDTNNDGTPDVYTADPNLYPGTSSSDTNKCISTACQTNWRNVTTVKIHLLASNTQATAGYLDTRTYTLGKTADMTTDNTFGPFNDTYKRHVYTTVVRMNNVAGRRE
jgi:type IV pilus assembly protein PilW